MKALWLLSITFSLSLVGHTVLADDGVSRMNSLKSDIDAVRHHRQSADVEALRYEGLVRGLKNRKIVQEEVIRHELHYVYPGEMLIDLEPYRP